METRSKRRKFIIENQKKMQQAFWSLPFDNPFWECVLPYLSIRDKISLRGVNRNCQDIVDSSFSKALSITVPSDMPPRLVKTMVGNNTCVITLTAQNSRTMNTIVRCLERQVRLVSVDLSHSVFPSVEFAVDILVDNCRLLETICFKSVSLSGNSRPWNTYSHTWPFRRLLRNPLPRLQHLDISGNGSRGLSTTMFASLLEKHPRLHTLSVDSRILASVVAYHCRVNVLLMVMRSEVEQRLADFVDLSSGGRGHLIKEHADLNMVLGTWLSSPTLTNLTLCLGGYDELDALDWILYKCINYPWRRIGCHPSASSLLALQCTKRPSADGSSPPQPEISCGDGWLKAHQETRVGVFMERGVLLKRVAMSQ